MKKGLILALLVVAMVALVLPVAARAPIIKALPTIIVGDNEGASGGKGIIRYPDALDLSSPSVVDWNNDESYTSDTFHAYLYPADATPATDVVAYNDTRIIGTLSSSEYSMLVSVGAVPAADTRITSYTGTYQNWALNLFDAGRHPSITSPATADPATQGVTQDSYSKDVAMKLVCGVTSGTKLVVSQGNLDVKCQSSTSDSIVRTFNEVVSYSFTGSNDGWAFSTYANFDEATPTTAGPGSTGIGFVVSSPISLTGPCMYSIWMSPANIPCGSAQAGKVYRATAALESTSASPDTALGFRLRYFSQGFAHQGFMICHTVTGGALMGDATNVPYANNPFTAKVFWAARPDLGDMGDSEGEANISGTDFRKYKVAWEIIGGTGESGTLTMEAFFVDSFAKPAAVTPAITWGTGGIAFNADATAGGLTTEDVLPFVYTHGSAAASATNVALTLTAVNGGAGADALTYYGVKTNFAAYDLNLVPVSNHLYRLSGTLACGSRTLVPTYRVGVNNQIRRTAAAAGGTADTFGVARAMEWIDWYSFTNVIATGAKQTSTLLPNQTVCPMAPATAGSVIDTYVYSHNIADTANGKTVFIPILSTCDAGAYGTGTAWGDPVTAMTWSSVTWEDLGGDY